MITLDDIKKSLDHVHKTLETLGINVHSPISDYVCFTQLWGSTALGFGGCGGDMMTEAVTTIVEALSPEDKKPRHYVFFGGRLAYAVSEPNEQFFRDMENENMASVFYASERYNQKTENEL